MNKLLLLLCMALPHSAFAAAIEPVYRFWNGRSHFYSRDYYEGQRRGYHSNQGQAFFIYTYAFSSDMRPLSQCVFTPQGERFLSTEYNCEGWPRESVIGYVLTQQHPNTLPLYRFSFSNGGWQDHITTTDYNEGFYLNYVYNGPQGFVPYYN